MSPIKLGLLAIGLVGLVAGSVFLGTRLNRPESQPAAVAGQPAPAKQAPVAKATVAPTIAPMAPVAQATSAPEKADSDPCAGKVGRDLALCQAKNKPAAKATGIPTITPFPVKGAVLSGTVEGIVEDALRKGGVEAAKAACDKLEGLSREACKGLVGQLAVGAAAVSPTPTPKAGGLDLVKPPDLGLFGQIIQTILDIWRAGWIIGRSVGLLGAIAGEIIWILFWGFGAKAIAQKKDDAGAIVWPWIWRVARWVAVTPIAALDALVPDEWLENPPELLQSAGALLALIGWLKGKGVPPTTAAAGGRRGRRGRR